LKKSALFIVLIFIVLTTTAYAGFFEDLFKSFGGGEQGDELDSNTIASGLKEALSIDPDHAFLQGMLTDAYKCSGDYDRAFEYWKKGQYQIWEKFGVTELLQVDRLILAYGYGLFRFWS